MSGVRFLRVSSFYVRPLRPPTPGSAPAALPEGVAVVRATAADPWWTPDGLLFPAGARELAVVLWHGRPAHVSGTYDRPGGVVLGGGYTRPEYRGRGFGTLALRALAARLAAQGHARVYAVCNARNTASRRAFRAAGFAFDRTVFTVRLGPWDPGRWLDALLRRVRRGGRRVAGTGIALVGEPR